jgi:SAM-dependent methyltransferase
MYTENPRKDLLLFARAVVTNQLARSRLYLKLGNRTGRGNPDETPAEAAAYFIGCVDDYLAELGVDASFLAGKRVLEYGPGDTLGVALVLYAYGAASVECVDRFPIATMTEKSVRIYQAILDALDRERARQAFNTPGDPRSGFSPAIRYRVTPDGVSGTQGAYDLVISRSVHALVNRLDRTFADIARALAPGGVSIHKVDLSSHGLDRYKRLDFLSWPDPIYRLMYSRKGRPNRWRVDRYQELARGAGLTIRKLSPTGKIDRAEVELLQPKLPARFRALDPEHLSWLGFWMVLDR